jgi:hypothetical protein
LSVGWLASMASNDCRTSSTDVTLPLASRYSRPVRVGRGDCRAEDAAGIEDKTIDDENIRRC